MTRIAVERQIAADPTSAALLLAGPAAVDLWPGARRADEQGNEQIAGDRLVVEVQLPPSLRGTDETGPAAASVVLRAHPPHRTPTSFVLRFAFVSEQLPPTRAVLTLSYSGSPVAGTSAVLLLDYDATAPAAVPGIAGALQGMAATFLANLARVAEKRATAA